ncbi:uncharacterized protein BJ212DRAFT_85521 [Suillus subaureus]|uniref:Uncharacterized protein n=1 Tax=Suillus subaureus TaxID=48587 RepID=A0A9P7EEH4_9AGAM|nr:uncharacterized protein BJ212DRAFT_85521 [Suillus subaureus]KAG1819308.1 hypothetical protein BJ212DRAFT_85521 [Suillus subaureus]
MLADVAQDPHWAKRVFVGSSRPNNPSLQPRIHPIPLCTGHNQHMPRTRPHPIGPQSPSQMPK